MKKTNKKAPLIMSISGVRGIVGKTLETGLIADLISAFSRWLGLNATVIVGRDNRASGDAISQIINGAFALSGIDVIDIGLAPTPTVQLMVMEKKAKGAVVVTASHNPIQWNGIKFIKSDGTFLTRKEIEKMFGIFRSKDFKFAESNKIGKIREDVSSNKIHIDCVLKNIDTKAIKKSKFKVLIDSVGGAGSKITPMLLKELGCKVSELNTEITGNFPRGTEPVPKNIMATAKMVKKLGCDIGFCQDPDADRLAIIDETGKAIGEEMTLALVISLILQKKKGPVVINQSTTRIIEDIAMDKKVPFYRTPVGEINVVEKMKTVKAIIGGEGNGGVIDPKIHLGRDSLVGIGYILELLAVTGKKVSTLVKELPQYYMKKETLPLQKNFTLLQRMVCRHFKSKTNGKIQILQTDGLRISFPDKRSWLHFRPSNTEPILRLIGEAPGEKELESLFREVKLAIKGKIN